MKNDLENAVHVTNIVIYSLDVYMWKYAGPFYFKPVVFGATFPSFSFGLFSSGDLVYLTIVSLAIET